MHRSIVLAFCLVLLFLAWQTLRTSDVHADAEGNWLQWGRDAQHNGASTAIGMIPERRLADVTYDPFVAQAQAESNGALLAHYQVSLIDDMVFIEFKTGTYTSMQSSGVLPAVSMRSGRMGRRAMERARLPMATRSAR